MLDGFIAHLAAARGRLPAAEADGVKRGAELIQHEAKDLIGTEYAGWAALAPSTIAEKERLGYTGKVSATDPLLRTGEMRATIQVSAEGRHAAIGTNDPVAEYQEFGTARIPARPFMGPAAYRKGKDAAKAVGLSVALVIAGKPAKP